MHRLTTAFVLGYHGCDESVAEKLLSGTRFNDSENEYDWLGSGVYFWEANPRRGLEFARDLMAQKASKIKQPAVVGAVIDLRLCLDLLSSTGVAAVKAAHDDFIRLCEEAGTEPPKNHSGEDLLLRNLDCAVINHLHVVRRKSDLPAFDTVRGVFLEGGRIYEASGFREKTHIQICVRNHDCITGVFRVPKAQLEI